MTALLRHLANLLLFWLPPTRLLGLRRWIWRLGGLRLGHGVAICGGGWIYGPGEVAIGEDTWLSPGVRMFSHVAAPIVIGPRCDLGPDVRLITGSHELGDARRRAGAGTAKPVTIGAGCWVGAASTILGGVTIGDGAVIAAGSMVTRDIPPQALAAGVPAAIKRRLGDAGSEAGLEGIRDRAPQEQPGASAPI